MDPIVLNPWAVLFVDRFSDAVCVHVRADTELEARAIVDSLEAARRE